MKRLLILAFLFVALPAVAQPAPPLTAANRVLWGAPSNTATIAEAQGLEYRLYVDGAATFTVLAHTCVAPTAPDLIASCSSPIPAAVLAVLNRIGGHEVRMTAFSASAALESEKTAPFVVKMGPGAPGNLRIP